MARLNLLLGILIIGLFVSGVSAYSYDSSFSGPPIAIDLGNTYCCIAGYEKGQYEKTFQICIPTWVAFTENATLVGEAAMNNSAVDPRRTLFGFKRFLGNAFADKDVQRGRKLMPYKIVEGSRYAALQVMVKDGEVEEFASFDAALVTAKVVSKLKEAAEAYLGVRVNEAFLLVPELWADAHVTAARDACRRAGLHILKTICESKAAAAAYGLKKKLPEQGTALIFHLGGGTASVTVLLFEKGVFEIMTERHDVYLGGRDFDKRIVDYLVERIKKKHNKDVSKDKVALAKLRTASEHAKKALSNQDHVWVKVESLFDSVDFSEPLTRAKFEELNNDLFLKAIELVEQAVRDVEEEILDIRKELINEIVLVGGSSRIPKIQKLLKDYFDGKEPNMQLKPDEALSYGAALLTLPSTAGCYQGIADFGHSVA